jgi:hypothetical protein
MNKTNEEFLEKIDNFYNLINSCNISLLNDEDFLTNIISTIGLYNEKDRRHPENEKIHIYGEDVKYMNFIENVGMWQIPRQLASFLIKLVSFENKIETFLDIGTCRGATITVITIYLLRFGIKSVETIDVINYLDNSLKNKWEELKLPIKYIIIPYNSSYLDYIFFNQYDVVFIDGHHDYYYVNKDYQNAKLITNKICFHDINDCFCHDVVRLWNEIKKNNNKTYEFTYHSHNYKLMGIGLVITNNQL